MSSKKLKKIPASSSWNIGDFAWFVPNGEKRPQQGEIVKLHESEVVPCVSLIMTLDSKYRTAKIETLAETSEAAKKLFQSKQ